MFVLHTERLQHKAVHVEAPCDIGLKPRSFVHVIGGNSEAMRDDGTNKEAVRGAHCEAVDNVSYSEARWPAARVLSIQISFFLHASLTMPAIRMQAS